MDLNQSWVYEVLGDEVEEGHNVSFIVLDEDPLFAQDNITLQKTNRFSKYIEPFKRFGVENTNIYFLESLSLQKFQEVVSGSDIIVLVRNPELSISYIDELHKDILCGFDGLIIGIGYGGLAQLDNYEDEDGYHEGFGLLNQMNILYDFRQDYENLSKALEALEMSGNDVIALPIESGVILDEDSFEMLGNGFVLSTSDMDDIYQAIQTFNQW